MRRGKLNRQTMQKSSLTANGLEAKLSRQEWVVTGALTNSPQGRFLCQVDLIVKMRRVQLRASQGLKIHGRATWKDLFMAESVAAIAFLKTLGMCANMKAIER